MNFFVSGEKNIKMA